MPLFSDESASVLSETKVGHNPGDGYEHRKWYPLQHFRRQAFLLQTDGERSRAHPERSRAVPSVPSVPQRPTASHSVPQRPTVSHSVPQRPERPESSLSLRLDTPAMRGLRNTKVQNYKKNFDKNR